MTILYAILSETFPVLFSGGIFMETYTIKDIARIAGVSVTTVSRVLNRRPDVNQATRKKVEQVIAECNFVGNVNARGLKQGSEVIGVVIRGKNNPFLNSLAEAILSREDSFPNSFLTEYIDERDDEFEAALRITRQNRVKGIIFVGSLIDERVRAIRGLDIPIVFTTVNAKNASLPNASSVAIDDMAMGRVVAEFLLDKGHRKIAVFGSNPVAGDSLAMRFQGFCEVFSERGLTFDQDYYFETRFSFQSGYENAVTFLETHPDTTAIFAMSDTVAVGAVRAIIDMGMSVPDDISVFGFDGIDICKFTNPRLSTVEQPVAEIARRSVSILLDMIDNKAEPCHIIVDSSIVQRESVATARQ